MSATTTGAQTIWAFVFEDSDAYAQEPGDPTDTEFKPFGDREEINEPSTENNSEALYRPFSRQPTGYLEGRFEGSGGTDFIYTNPYWMSFVFGQPEVTESSSPVEYTSTYDFDPTNTPATAHVIEETHYADGSVGQTVYIGTIAEGMSVDVDVDGEVEVSFDWAFADERNYDDATASPIGEIGTQPDTEYCPLHFGNADLFLDLDNDGTAERQGRVQSVSFDFSLSAEINGELGTRKGTTPSFLEVEPNITYQKYLEDAEPDTERRSVYGSLETQSGEDYYAPLEQLCGETDSNIAGRVELGSNDATNSLTLMFGESFPESYQRTNTGSPDSALEDDVERNLLSLTATATTEYDPTPTTN